MALGCNSLPLRLVRRVARARIWVYIGGMLDLRYVVDHLDEVRAALVAPRRGGGRQPVGDRRAERPAQRRDQARSRRCARSTNEANEAMAKADKQSDEFRAQRERSSASRRRASSSRRAARGRSRARAGAAARAERAGRRTSRTARTSDDNVFVRAYGEKPSFDFKPRDHVEVGVALGLLDFERAVKISGSALRGAARRHGARLTRALMAFMLDLHTREHGYTEIWPPALVNDDQLRGTGPAAEVRGRLVPHRADWDDSADRRRIRRRREARPLSVPTAEVPLTNLHARRDPRGRAAADPLHARTRRASAARPAAYGKDTRGLIRQHQFDKVELVQLRRTRERLTPRSKQLAGARRDGAAEARACTIA